MRKTGKETLERKSYIAREVELDLEEREIDHKERIENIESIKAIRRNTNIMIWVLVITAVVSVGLVILDSVYLPRFDVDNGILKTLIVSTIVEGLVAVALRFGPLLLQDKGNKPNSNFT